MITGCYQNQFPNLSKNQNQNHLLKIRQASAGDVDEVNISKDKIKSTEQIYSIYPGNETYEVEMCNENKE